MPDQPVPEAAVEAGARAMREAQRAVLGPRAVALDPSWDDPATATYWSYLVQEALAAALETGTVIAVPKDVPRYKLWLCDECGDHAEVEPGDECEVCCSGTVREVEVAPLQALGLLPEQETER